MSLSALSATPILITAHKVPISTASKKSCLRPCIAIFETIKNCRMRWMCCRRDKRLADHEIEILTSKISVPLTPILQPLVDRSITIETAPLTSINIELPAKVALHTPPLASPALSISAPPASAPCVAPSPRAEHFSPASSLLTEACSSTSSPLLSSSSSSTPSLFSMPEKVREAFAKVHSLNISPLTLEEGEGLFRIFHEAVPITRPTCLDERVTRAARSILIGREGGVGFACLNKGCDKIINRGTFKTVYHGVGLHDGKIHAIAECDIEKTSQVKKWSKEQVIALLEREKEFNEEFTDTPGIIKTYCVVTTPDKFYFVMDLCEGGDLFDHLNMLRAGKKQKIPMRDRLILARQLLSGVVFMHQKGVIHRDIKPENILLHTEREGGLIDFGFATKADDQSRFGFRYWCGSPGYMAPELTIRSPASPKVDVWAFGMILYHLVTLVDFPWQCELTNIGKLDKTPRCLTWKPLFGTMPILAQSHDDDQALKELIIGMMRVDPEKRLSSEEALNRLDAILRNLDAHLENSLDRKREA